MNTLDWTPKAYKQLHKLGHQQKLLIWEGVQDLMHMPECRNVTALVNHGSAYRLRIGHFRVLFDWHSGVRVVEIQEVKKRDERTY